MSVTVITRPASIVTLAEAKRFMRVADDHENELIQMLIDAAQAEIEPPDSWIGRAFGVQTLEVAFDGCEFSPRAEFELPCPPYADIVSVKYDDRDGIERTVERAQYVIVGSSSFPRLMPAYGQSWPSARRSPGAVRVRYQAGYTAGDRQLEPARMAVILMAQRLRGMAREDMFLRKETVDGVGSSEWALTGQAAEMAKQAADHLLARYRITLRV